MEQELGVNVPEHWEGAVPGSLSLPKRNVTGRSLLVFGS